MNDAPQRDADATKKRLLEAAATEFARYGIAGARVDRIAAEARSNKAQIYHYFGSKDQLFDAVFENVVALVLNEVPLDATRLPEYAAQLHDGYIAHPEIARLATWYQLERGGTVDLIQAIVDSNEKKVEAIRAAQDVGSVGTKFTPVVLLGLVIHTASLWSNQTPEYLALAGQVDLESRRASVARAVELLIS